MPNVKAYAVFKAKEPLGPFQAARREPGPHDVVIDIHYCGVCHSDLHQARNEWGGATYPMVPGHEITGKVAKIGNAVTRHKVGDSVGVGVFMDSCRTCGACKDHEENYCENGVLWTYGATQKDGTPTYGGYSVQTVTDENYVLKIPANLPLDKAAPLLCAGITTYSPLRHWKVKPGDEVAIVGLGGLGHMGVKLAAAMGAKVTVISTSERKKADATRMGATNFLNSTDAAAMKTHANRFSLIINTASGNTSLDTMLGLLARNGSMVLVGAPEHPGTVAPFSLIGNRRRLAGSGIGGMKETQEMLDFCGQKNITADIEVIAMDKINEAYERMLKSDVRYRFVIDLATLK